MYRVTQYSPFPTFTTATSDGAEKYADPEWFYWVSKDQTLSIPFHLFESVPWKCWLGRWVPTCVCNYQRLKHVIFHCFHQWMAFRPNVQLISAQLWCSYSLSVSSQTKFGPFSDCLILLLCKFDHAITTLWTNSCLFNYLVNHLIFRWEQDWYSWTLSKISVLCKALYSKNSEEINTFICLLHEFNLYSVKWFNVTISLTSVKQRAEHIN